MSLEMLRSLLGLPWSVHKPIFSFAEILFRKDTDDSGTDELERVLLGVLFSRTDKWKEELIISLLKWGETVFCKTRQLICFHNFVGQSTCYTNPWLGDQKSTEGFKILKKQTTTYYIMCSLKISVIVTIKKAWRKWQNNENNKVINLGT